ncbi:hypothetical protein Dsin_023177 [Dipteronia sinensis]|uniref:Transposase n=1 Tax=Dipteronia sinensis TaxID=43782 RepID=A0AAE0A3U3_9ROSI|nr:hypothetical protein Dsin_023177 [Dipteronia sinensis]
MGRLLKELNFTHICPYHPEASCHPPDISLSCSGHRRRVAIPPAAVVGFAFVEHHSLFVTTSSFVDELQRQHLAVFVATSTARGRSLWPSSHSDAAIIADLGSISDWQLATIMVEHLQPFYNLTEFFSGTKYPPANLVFLMICKMRETMNMWVSSHHIEIPTMARSMIAKFEKYWNDIPSVMVVTAVLGPRYKMLWVEFRFGRLYGFDADRQRDKMHGLLKELITEYETEALLMGVEQVEESSSFDYSIEVLGGDEEFELYKSHAVSSLNKSELERYLGEQVENNTPNFDILSWWKVNKGKHPMLAKVAKDILAIPVSIVASEFAFSPGGRFLSPHRRRLHPHVGGLDVCTKLDKSSFSRSS